MRSTRYDYDSSSSDKLIESGSSSEDRVIISIDDAPAPASRDPRYKESSATDEAAPLLADQNDDASVEASLPFALQLNTAPMATPEPKGLATRVWDKAKKIGGYLKEHPITATLGLFTSMQPAVNAALAPTNGSPKDLSMTWWNQLSPKDKALSIVFFSCSLSVNFILAMFFLPKAQNDLKNIFTHFKDHPIIGTISIILGLFGAVALGMLAYDAFSAFPIYIAATFSSLNIAINFATRLVSVKGVAERVYNAVRPTPKTIAVKNLIDHLQRIKPEHQHVINQRLGEIAPRIPRDNLNPDVIRLFHEELIKGLINELDKLSRNPQTASLFDKHKPLALLIKQGAFITSDVILALSAASIGFCIFTEKGFNGFKTIESFVGTSHLESLSPAYKILLGSASGTASAMLYLSSLLDLRTALANAGTQLTNHPAEIPLALMMLTACAASSVSMYNVASNMTSNPSSLFPFLVKQMPIVFKGGATLGGFGVNTRASAMRLFDKEPNMTSPTLDDVIEYLDNNGSSLSDATVSTLAQLSVLKPADTTNAAPSHDLEHGFSPV